MNAQRRAHSPTAFSVSSPTDERHSSDRPPSSLRGWLTRCTTGIVNSRRHTKGSLETTSARIETLETKEKNLEQLIRYTQRKEQEALAKSKNSDSPFKAWHYSVLGAFAEHERKKHGDRLTTVRGELVERREKRKILKTSLRERIKLQRRLNGTSRNRMGSEAACHAIQPRNRGGASRRSQSSGGHHRPGGYGSPHSEYGISLRTGPPSTAALSYAQPHLEPRPRDSPRIPRSSGSGPEVLASIPLHVAPPGGHQSSRSHVCASIPRSHHEGESRRSQSSDRHDRPRGYGSLQSEHYIPSLPSTVASSRGHLSNPRSRGGLHHSKIPTHGPPSATGSGSSRGVSLVERQHRREYPSQHYGGDRPPQRRSHSSSC